MRVKRLDKNNKNQLPSKATEQSAGFDLRALTSGVVHRGCRQLVKTGFAIAIPAGMVGVVCPRSVLALKYGVTVLNAPGIIDRDYRGDVGVILINHGADDFEYKQGDRIAQLVIVSEYGGDIMMYEVDDLDDTDRGAGGFGHTGTD